MKKVISCALALFLMCSVFSFATFAASPTLMMGQSGTDLLDDSQVKDFGNLVIGKDDLVLHIPIKYWNFITDSGVAATVSDFDTNLKNDLHLEFQDPSTGAWNDRIPSGEPLAYYFNYSPSKGGNPPEFTVTGENIGTVESLRFRLRYKNPVTNAEIFSQEYEINGEFLDPTINSKITDISGVNLADSTNKFPSPYPVYSQVTLNGIGSSYEITNLNDLTGLTIFPGDKLYFRFDTDYFVWEPNIAETHSLVRKSTLVNNQVSVITTIAAGKDIIKSADFQNVNGRAYVVVEFTDDFDQVKERDFDFTVALGLRGMRNAETAVQLMGTFSNEVLDVYEGTDYVFIGDGTVVAANTGLRNVKLDLGEGVVVTVNMIEDKKYYGKATNELSQDDVDIMNYFPTIRRTLTLSAVNIENSARYVTLEDNIKYYVYDANGTYLGRVGDQLAYRNKYYLSTDPLNFGGDVDIVLSEPNLNENPSTGA